jgi:hypothetical protein
LSRSINKHGRHRQFLFLIGRFKKIFSSETVWPGGFRGEDFLEINQSETRTACGSHVCWWIGTKLAIFIEDLPRMLPTKFDSNCLGKWPKLGGKHLWEVLYSVSSKQNGRWATQAQPTEPQKSKDRQYNDLKKKDKKTTQVSIHLARRFQRIRFFRNQPIRNKNCLWWPCLLTDRNEISNLYRGPSKDASYQIRFIWPSGYRNELKLGRKHPWKVIYKDCSFISGPLINMAATGHSCFWLVNF